MTTFQKVIKYCAIALAIFIIISMALGIASLIANIVGFFDNENYLGEFQKTEIDSKDIRNLDIDINASALTIKSGDKLLVETNNKKLKVNSRNGTLFIEENTRRFYINDNHSTIILYIPNEITFDVIDIQTGAGIITIDGLRTQQLSLMLGAGETTLKNIDIKKSAEIEGGAGKLSFENASINDLDFDIGVGEVVFSGALYGSATINSGVGALTMNLDGTKDIYSITIDKGIGSVMIENNKISDGDTVGNGSNKIDIDGGVGAITIEFN